MNEYPKITPRGPISARIRALEDAVTRVAPLRSAGTLTSRTTRGVFRRAIPDSRASTGTAVARWA